MMNKRFLLTILLLVTLITAACGRNGAPDRGDVVVYVAVPLSGFQANGGQTVLGGVRLAAAEINNAGGLLGYRVVVRPLDDESDSNVAVERAEEIRQAIANGERVLAVIGHLNSGQTLAAMEIYKNLPLVVISATASEQSLTERNYDNFFRVNANDRVQAEVSADFLVQRLQAKSVAVLHNDTEYGRGLAASLIEGLRARGATVAMQAEVAEGQSTYVAEVQRIRSAAPDAVFYAGYEIEAPYLRVALVESDIDLPMLASDGAFLAATIDEANGAAEGMYVSAFAPSPRNAADSKWVEAYQAVEYRNPDTYSVNGYVAMQVLAEAVRKANSFDRSAVADSLRKNSFDSLLSTLRFEPDGDLVDPKIWIYQVVNDEFEQVEN
ncbi:MAG: branched-chain amino acid ABC transporter substrate-binding protein [Caldilinea sp.]